MLFPDLHFHIVSLWKATLTSPGDIFFLLKHERARFKYANSNGGRVNKGFSCRIASPLLFWLFLLDTVFLSSTQMYPKSSEIIFQINNSRRKMYSFFLRIGPKTLMGLRPWRFSEKLFVWIKLFTKKDPEAAYNPPLHEAEEQKKCSIEYYTSG